MKRFGGWLVLLCLMKWLELTASEQGKSDLLIMHRLPELDVNLFF